MRRAHLGGVLAVNCSCRALARQGQQLAAIEFVAAARLWPRSAAICMDIICIRSIYA